VTRALFVILFAAGLALIGSGQEKADEKKPPAPLRRAAPTGETGFRA